MDGVGNVGGMNGAEDIRCNFAEGCDVVVWDLGWETGDDGREGLSVVIDGWKSECHVLEELWWRVGQGGAVEYWVLE